MDFKHIFLANLWLDRPPSNLLRQELVGTGIYLDILQKTISQSNTSRAKPLEDASADVDTTSVDNNSSMSELTKVEENLEGIAEEKLVSFCGQILREVSDLQLSIGETANMDIHRVLELRSPITVKVYIQINIALLI